MLKLNVKVKKVGDRETERMEQNKGEWKTGWNQRQGNREEREENEGQVEDKETEGREANQGQVEEMEEGREENGEVENTEMEESDGESSSEREEDPGEVQDSVRQEETDGESEKETSVTSDTIPVLDENDEAERSLQE